MRRIVYLEHIADDPERAKDFYEKVFDWKISRKAGPQEYWIIAAEEEKYPIIEGGIMGRMNNGAICNMICVPSINEFLEKIEQAGGKTITDKTQVPGEGFLAYCTDTEGYVFGIIEQGSSS